MASGWGRRIFGDAAVWLRRAIALTAAGCTVALAGCNLHNQQAASAMQPRGATVAFDSIDGLPPDQFKKLVQSLNDEAQTRRMAVMSRQTQSAYRVRGYLAAEIARDRTTVSWVWDVFDRNDIRALRIAGMEVAKGRLNDGWKAADDAMLKRIANSGMDKLAAFLTSPEATSGTTEAMVAEADPAPSSPEARGIFRIFSPRADPVSIADDDRPDAAPATRREQEVPVPRRRPVPVAMGPQPPVTLAAAEPDTY